MKWVSGSSMQAHRENGLGRVAIYQLQCDTPTILKPRHWKDIERVDLQQLHELGSFHCYDTPSSAADAIFDSDDYSFLDD